MFSSFFRPVSSFLNKKSKKTPESIFRCNLFFDKKFPIFVPSSI